MGLTIAYSKIKQRNLVLINNDTYQRETLSELPIRQPLRPRQIHFDSFILFIFLGGGGGVRRGNVCEVEILTGIYLKGCGMGPWLVLVSPCFRENVVATCKIGSFLCSLDNLLQKNVIVLFFGNQISKWRSFEKRAILTYFSHILVTRESYKNSFSTYVTHIHTCILLTLLTFFALPILKKIRIYQIWFLFGKSPCVDSYSCHFGTVNK